ncbi:hypothetical protein [Flagellimonas crocea]|uniref:hypothetical protein n=1 Tax=Flagellimonas crocea TaxID=3067311 RepID=UPI00296F35C0|nr:hypothetical protein [Muricauda sp. DH64]
MKPLTSFERYKRLHLWLLIPFVISVLGFFYSYYLKLASATFHQHIHGISATLWYVLVIVQPYIIIHRKNFIKHRTYGIIGIVLAGIVAGSAFTIIPLNINNVAELDPNGFFNPTFAYFATFYDFILVSMFILSVVMAILKVKKLEQHVQWLIASVLFVLSPGLLRLIGVIAIIMNEGDLGGIMMVDLAYPTLVVMLFLFVFYYYKFGSFRHLSFKLLVLAHLPILFIKWLGDNQVLRSAAEAIFKY